MNVQQLNQSRPADWPYTEDQMRQMLGAVQREAYPPARRTGVGPAVRRHR